MPDYSCKFLPKSYSGQFSGSLHQRLEFLFSPLILIQLRGEYSRFARNIHRNESPVEPELPSDIYRIVGFIE
jgi:hypothetical protein